MVGWNWFIWTLLTSLLALQISADDADPTTAAPSNETDPQGRTLLGSRSGCFPSPCPSGTYCFDNGFGSASCVTGQSVCFSNTCLNGGTCSPSGSSYVCTCPPTYYGTHCENGGTKTIDPCFPNPCRNNGICSAFGGTRKCTCQSTYSGTHCEIYNGRSPCAINPCRNGGQCQIQGLGYVCNCLPNYMGSTCQYFIPPESPCQNNPCQNGGRCQAHGQSYVCNCLPNYMGSTCQYFIPPESPCQNNPCQNGGRCQAHGQSYVCICLPNYMGSNCERFVSRVSPCQVNPCRNGGRCQAQGQSYVCVCVSPYTGTHCEVGVRSGDPCTGGFNPCNNLCECVRSCRHASGYYCRSSNGYLGKDCTIPPPTIQCQPNQVVVTVDDAFVREYDLGIGNSRLHMAHAAQDLAAQDCFATTSNGISHTFTVPLPFNKCGTTVDVSSGKTVVTNNIWLNRATSGGYDMPVPVICFECTYEKQYVIVTSLEPAIDQPPVLRQTGFQTVQGVIELCKSSSSCPLSCPAAFSVTQGAVYTVGEMIHLRISGGQSQFQNVIALKTLYLSCDGNPSSAAVVQLVTARCPGGSTNYMPTTITHSGQSGSICVSFQVPRLQGCSVFYIHAEVDSCGPAGCAYNAASCQGTRVLPGYGGRKRRSSLDHDLDLDGFVDIYGPISALNGQFGISREILFPNKSLVNTPALIDDLLDQQNMRGGVGWFPGNSFNDPVLDPKESDFHVPLPAAAITGLVLLCLLIVLLAAGLIVVCFRNSLPRK